MAIVLIGFGVVALLLCADMARVCIEDGAWLLAAATIVLAVMLIVGIVMTASIAVSQA